jgi:hypothetical protein
MQYPIEPLDWENVFRDIRRSLVSGLSLSRPVVGPVGCGDNYGWFGCNGVVHSGGSMSEGRYGMMKYIFVLALTIPSLAFAKEKFISKIGIPHTRSDF